MQPDNHPKIKEGFRIAVSGDIERGRRMEDEGIQEVVEASDGHSHCSCPKLDCRLHGKCMECIIAHRGHADHLPVCMHAIVNERIAVLSGLTEGSVVELIGNKSK